MNDKAKALLKVILLFVFVSALLQWLLPTVNSNEFQDFVKGLGVFAPIIIILYVIISHIFAPIAGSPGVLLGYAIFGVVKTSIYLYIASLISAVINFYIARRYGRSWVAVLVGKKSIKEVDEFVDSFGDKILAISRVFGFPIFEVISYASGLTSMPFKKYFYITAIFSVVPSIVFLLLFRNADFTQPLNMGLWIGGLIIIGAIFLFFLKKYYSKKHQK